MSDQGDLTQITVRRQKTEIEYDKLLYMVAEQTETECAKVVRHHSSTSQTGYDRRQKQENSWTFRHSKKGRSPHDICQRLWLALCLDTTAKPETISKDETSTKSELQKAQANAAEQPNNRILNSV